MRNIPLSSPYFGGDELKNIKNCLDTGWVSSCGNYVNEFETKISEYVGSRYTVATVNGTCALHVALKLIDIKADEEVIAPTLTFIAPINAIKYCGAYPVFMDCEPDHLNVDIEKTMDFIKRECSWRRGRFINKKTRRKISAILVVDVFGYPVDVRPLMNLAKNYNIPIVEDACEGLGSKYFNRYAGTLGDIGVFSFNGNKIITTGGGGMIVTNNKRWAMRARYLVQQAKDDPQEYIHNEIGYNYRMTNLQAALGLAQLEQIDRFIMAKRRNAALYRKYLTGVGQIRFMAEEEPGRFSNRWLCYIHISNGDMKAKMALLSVLNRRGFQSRSIWRPNHLQRPYSKCQTYKVEIATKVYGSVINIPSDVRLQGFEIKEICNFLNRYRP